jgi:hypothetical protein
MGAVKDFEIPTSWAVTIMAPSTLSIVCSWLSVFFSILAVSLIWSVSSGTDQTTGYLGGFDYNHIFAWHPLLMTMGMIMCTIIALNSYTILPLTHSQQKVVHVLFHTSALFCFSFGLNAVVKSHNGQNTAGAYMPNLYSMHSWVGLGALCLYVQNYVLGFAYFVTRNFEGAKEYLPSHLKLGLCALLMSTAAVISGISQLKLCIYVVTSPDTNPAAHYSDMTSGCKKMQGSGVCVALAVMLSFFALIPNKPDPNASSADAGELRNPLILNQAKGSAMGTR